MQHVGQALPVLVIGLVLIGISALIVARVSARKLVAAMLVWLFLPAIFMAIVLAFGSLMSPAQGSGASNAIFGIMLIGIFIVVPWAIVCAIGFAIGFIVRRKALRESSVSPEPAPAPAGTTEASGSPPDTATQTHLAASAPVATLSHTSPDGSIRVEIQPVEWASSQWVHTPRVIEVATGRVLCDLLGTDWQADVAFPGYRTVWLGLRRYRSPGYLFAQFDLDQDRYRIALDTVDRPEEEGPLGDISARLEQWWQRATARASAGATGAAVAGAAPRPHPFAAWRAALVILAGAIIAIAALTWFSLKTGIEPPHVPILRPGANAPH